MIVKLAQDRVVDVELTIAHLLVEMVAVQIVKKNCLVRHHINYQDVFLVQVYV